MAVVVIVYLGETFGDYTGWALVGRIVVAFGVLYCLSAALDALLLSVSWSMARTPIRESASRRPPSNAKRVLSLYWKGSGRTVRRKASLYFIVGMILLVIGLLIGKAAVQNGSNKAGGAEPPSRVASANGQDERERLS